MDYVEKQSHDFYREALHYRQSAIYMHFRF